MPDQETAFRNDKVLYWEKSTPDRFGQSKVSAYDELDVRWDDQAKLGRDAQGNKVQLDSTIIAAQRMLVGSIVLHETAAYYVGTGSETDPLELYEVLTENVTPDIKNRASAYVIGLGRYKGDLPEIVA